MPKMFKEKTSPDQIAEKASRGEDVSGYFTNRFTVVKPVHRVNLDLTSGMLRKLDERAARLNISRQAVIKTLLDGALDDKRPARAGRQKKGKLTKPTTTGVVTAQQLIEKPIDLRPHVVVLGAGASRASFPNGDSAGKPLPVMDDLINELNLRSLCDEVNLGLDRENNFEVFYSRLATNPGTAPLAKKIESRVEEYFSGLALPDTVTIYDRLLLSLRATDAIFTFNWDPCLFDAYKRNCNTVPLPKIFFLHGNVRIGACSEDNEWGEKNQNCPQCRSRFRKVPLLYPIQNKNYAIDPYIRNSWEAARILFRDAFTITIFGYGAPVSDAEAVELLKRAWFERDRREFEHIQIIDIASASTLHDRWSSFAPTHHYNVVQTFENSRIPRWPRRSVESLLYPMREGLPCQDFPLRKTERLSELQECAMNIAQNENNLSSLS